MTDNVFPIVDWMVRRDQRAAQRADLAALANVLATVRVLLEQHLVANAHSTAWTVLADSMPTSSLGEPGGIGGHSDPTLRAVEANNEITAQLDEIHARLAAMASDATRVFRLATMIVGAGVQPAASDPPGAGTCQRCERWVSGSSSDRIRSGWCEACFKRWTRAGRPDRTEFNRSSDEPA